MAIASESRISALQGLGQSVWLDFVSRQLLKSGGLKKLIDENGIQGMTSNPTIFDKAISQSTDYDEQIKALVKQGADADAIYQNLTITDIQEALDAFRLTYDRSQGKNGFVSLEVSPLLAHKTEETLNEARTLWKRLDRPNAMIKIPGTPEGVPAVEEALAEGININVTLLFSLEAYEAVAKAYIRALRRRQKAGQPIDRIASVASFFVSRIDTKVDKEIDQMTKAVTAPERLAGLRDLKGKIAIANAKNAYAIYVRLFDSAEFSTLRADGARVQRLLWASVGAKNPDYPDTLYIDDLIGPETVSTMPPETFDAFKDHGKAQTTLTSQMDVAANQMKALEKVGIDFKKVTDELVAEGVASFAKSFESLMGSIRAKREKLASR